MNFLLELLVFIHDDDDEDDGLLYLDFVFFFFYDYGRTVMLVVVHDFVYVSGGLCIIWKFFRNTNFV